jgi:hypothetical protein
MRRTLGVGIVLLLFGLLNPDTALAQGTQERSSRSKGNYPNPFNPETRIPFSLFDEDFRDGKPAIVTIRIFNIMQQLVAIPKAESHPNGGAPLVNRLAYFPPARDWVAFWDGTDRAGNKVASGTYFYIVEVNGVRAPPKPMVVTK